MHVFFLKYLESNNSSRYVMACSFVGKTYANKVLKYQRGEDNPDVLCDTQKLYFIYFPQHRNVLKTRH